MLLRRLRIVEVATIVAVPVLRVTPAVPLRAHQVIVEVPLPVHRVIVALLAVVVIAAGIVPVVAVVDIVVGQAAVVVTHQVVDAKMARSCLTMMEKLLVDLVSNFFCVVRNKM